MSEEEKVKTLVHLNSDFVKGFKISCSKKAIN